MKARNTVTIGLLASCLLVSSSTTCGAKLLKSSHKQPAQAAASTPQVPAAPELVAADQKVAKAREQLDTAHKQLEAAKALVRAGEADYKASKAAREALTLQLKADKLADTSGLKQLASQAASPSSQPAPTTTTTVPVQQDTAGVRVQQGDFNAEPAPSSLPQLR